MKLPLRAALGTLALIVALSAIQASQAAQLGQSALFGTVTAEGEAVPGVTIKAQSEDTGEVSMTLTNADGNFTFQRLPAGRYKVEVTLEGFAALSQEVTLNVGRNTTLEFEILPVATPITGVLWGAIKNQNGSPIAGANVTFKGPDDKERRTEAESDGGYRQAGLVPGTWELTITASGYHSAESTVTLKPREDKEQNFTLKKN